MSQPNSRIQVQVMACTTPRHIQTAQLDLPAGATVQAALQHLAAQSEWQAIVASALSGDWTNALWGRKAGLADLLRTGDRLELCRPLLVDPMVARRERFATQGARGAGLFSKRRSGAKAGY